MTGGGGAAWRDDGTRPDTDLDKRPADFSPRLAGWYRNLSGWKWLIDEWSQWIWSETYVTNEDSHRGGDEEGNDS